MKNKLILFFITWFINLSAIFIISRLSPPIASLIYWLILMLFIFTIWLFKISSKIVLPISFGLFIIAGLLTTFNLTIMAEMIMRISLLGWLIGVIQAIFEYLFEKR